MRGAAKAQGIDWVRTMRAGTIIRPAVGGILEVSADRLSVLAAEDELCITAYCHLLPRCAGGGNQSNRMRVG